MVKQLNPGEGVVSGALLHVSADLQKGCIAALWDSKNHFFGCIFLNMVETEVSSRIRDILREFKEFGSHPDDIVAKLIANNCGDGIKKVIRSTFANYHINIAAAYSGNAHGGLKVECDAQKTGEVRYMNLGDSSPAKRISVLIVDDSRTIRAMLREMLSSDRNIEIVGEAENPLVALELIKELKPDVITLDINMPEMNGITFLEKHLNDPPIPTVIISSAANEGSDLFNRAFKAGAFECLTKPSPQKYETYQYKIVNTVKEANRSKLQRRRMRTVTSKSKGLSINSTIGKIIAIGASTGGTEAVSTVLKSLPENVPPILIIQHIPKEFSGLFANRLNSECRFKVCEAENGMKLLPNQAYVAPGGQHMKVVDTGFLSGMVISLSNDPPINHFRPSVDYLFNSLVKNAKGTQIVACLLTGMGEDGAQGMLQLKLAGMHTIAQDEETSLVYGMPRAAKELGAASKIVPIYTMAENIIEALNRTVRNFSEASPSAPPYSPFP